MSAQPPILVVTDSGLLRPDVAAPLQGRVPIGTRRAADIDRVPCSGFALAIVDVDLAQAIAAPGTPERFARLNSMPRLFVVDSTRPDSIREATVLGAGLTLARPFTPPQLLASIQDLLGRRPSAPAAAAPRPPRPLDRPAAPQRSRRPAASGEPVLAIQRAIKSGESALASAFAVVGSGGAPQIAPFKDASHSFVASLAEAASSAASLSTWLDTVRSHHSATFRHSLTVTANAVLFGLHLGLREIDLERLAIAGLLHDIGKSVVPLEVLDKPGRLDEAERSLIERHPQVGRDLLLRSGDSVPPELIDAVAQHHEYLDGSGYPERLTAGQLSDLVRITTIADIFTALVEERSYKLGMEPAKAVGILSEMAGAGKLDPVLVRHFAVMAEASVCPDGSPALVSSTALSRAG